VVDSSGVVLRVGAKGAFGALLVAPNQDVRVKVRAPPEMLLGVRRIALGAFFLIFLLFGRLTIISSITGGTHTKKIQIIRNLLNVIISIFLFIFILR